MRPSPKSSAQAVALLDANVLYPPLLRDILVSLAFKGLYQARWSKEILDEVERNLAKRVGTATARERIVGLRTLLPEAMVVDYNRHLEELLNDPKDRHVVAAALEGEATLIVTRNIKDFRMLPAGISAATPDIFLCEFRDSRDQVFACLEDVRAGWPQPPTLNELLAKLESTAPRFSRQMRGIE